MSDSNNKNKGKSAVNNEDATDEAKVNSSLESKDVSSKISTDDNCPKHNDGSDDIVVKQAKQPKAVNNDAEKNDQKTTNGKNVAKLEASPSHEDDAANIANSVDEEESDEDEDVDVDVEVAPARGKGKKVVPKKKRSESVETSDVEEEKNDTKKSVPLLDQPLELSGKRERKTVQRFCGDSRRDTKDKKLDIPIGRGVPLGTIPNVQASISRCKIDDLKTLHRILFNTTGKSRTVQRSLKAFCGFEFEKDSELYGKKMASLGKFALRSLKRVCEIIGVPQNGSKDEVTTRILTFLLEPVESGRQVGSGGRPKRSAAVKANNRGYSSHDNYSSDEKHSTKRTTRNKGQQSNYKEETSSSDNYEDGDESEDSHDDEEKQSTSVQTRKQATTRKRPNSDDDDLDTPVSSDDDDSTDAHQNHGKKIARKSSSDSPIGRKKPAKKATKAVNKKNNSAKTTITPVNSKTNVQDDDSSSEDEPLIKKAKSAQPPNDEEIKNYVKEILDGANLEEITMKNVCQKVYDHYPDFDLTHKKDYIKNTVKSLISK